MRLVLIVEDEDLASEGLVVELERRGLGCDLARDFVQAIQSLGSQSYSAIVIDLMLPEGTLPTTEQHTAPVTNEHLGVQLMRRIRGGEFGQAGTKRDTPIFVLTAVIERAMRDAVSGLNPEAVFTKPESPAYVAEHIKLCLEDQACSQTPLEG